MAQHAVAAHGISVAPACPLPGRACFECLRGAFSISQRCYRYVPLLADENEKIESWLIALIKARKNWCIRLCCPLTSEVPRGCICVM
jgi:putative transposase